MSREYPYSDGKALTKTVNLDANPTGWFFEVRCSTASAKKQGAGPFFALLYSVESDNVDQMPPPESVLYSIGEAAGATPVSSSQHNPSTGWRGQSGKLRTRCLQFKNRTAYRTRVYNFYSSYSDEVILLSLYMFVRWVKRRIHLESYTKDSEPETRYCPLQPKLLMLVACLKELVSVPVIVWEELLQS